MFDSEKNIINLTSFYFFVLKKRSEIAVARGRENPRIIEFLSFLTDDLAYK